MVWWTLGLAAGAGAAIAGRRVWSAVRERGLDQWVPGYVSGPAAAPPLDPETADVDVLISVCDHYEPAWGSPDRATALGRVQAWREAYPRLFGEYRDTSGRPPQHTFFFPQDHYQPEYLDVLKDLCAAGFGDVDIHLHHEHDTAATLTEKLVSFRDTLWSRHELLRRDPVSGQVVWGFIHGNWALCNSRRDRQWCGVDHEIPVLLATGCYADFTMPSAPSDTQTQTINQIYYAQDTPRGTKAHNTGTRARVGQAPPRDALLMIQGPLVFDHTRAKWGILPKIENGDLLGNSPPAVRRMAQWLKAGVCVAGAPQIRFVKLHTHGCKPANQQMWLGPQAQEFHAGLAALHQRNPKFRYHYVTAWEMARIARAIEQGHNWKAVIAPAAAVPA